MKTKTETKTLFSGSYLEQAMLKGLNPKQRSFAKDQVKYFESVGSEIPYGIIRKCALTQTELTPSNGGKIE